MSDIENYIGNTPLVLIDEIGSNKIFGKLEGNNPAGSIKDRPAIKMIKDAENQGLIKKGDTLIEATSGNTGIALAMAASVRGFKMKLIMPETASIERVKTMKAYGAEVILVSKEQDMEGARDLALSMSQNNEGYVLDQFSNKSNYLSHYEGTGPEIYSQTNGKITHLIACSGTGGTISGIGRFLKEKNNDVKIIGVDAYGSILKKYHETGEIDPNEIYSYRIEGLGKNIVPSATDFKIIDKFVKVTDSDSAYMAREITLNEGLFVGYTSGAAFQATKILNDENEFDHSSCVVIVFPDHGSRYLSKIYSDEWMNNQGFYDSSFYQPKKNSINYI